MLQVLLVMDYFDTVVTLKKTVEGVSFGTPFFVHFCHNMAKIWPKLGVIKKGFCKFSVYKRLTKSFW